MDQKIRYGLIAIGAFLIIFLASTLYEPAPETEPDKTPLEQVQEQQAYQNDVRLYETAIIEQNSIYCDRIADAELKESCLAEGFESKPEGTQTQNPPITEERAADIRLYEKAIINNDSSYCEQIQDSEIRVTCQNENLGDGSEMQTPNEPEHSSTDIRNYEQALIEQDSSYCYNIQDEDLRETCLLESA